MATTLGTLSRPGRTTGPARHTHRRAGLRLAAVGFVAALVVFVGGIAGAIAANDGAGAAGIASGVAWTFGLATAAFVTVKAGIATILVGIVDRLGERIDSLKATLPDLLPDDRAAPHPFGEASSAHGRAVGTEHPPRPLPIHRMARILWAPMLVMGLMLVAIGLVLALVAAGTADADPTLAATQHAWVQGIQFLGEGAVLSGISFLLGIILATIRERGGEVQASLGLTVLTLRMPATAKAFVVLMMAGLAVEIVQFVGYAILATDGFGSSAPAAAAVLGPLREFGLGLLLTGIVLALATIGRALSFQSDRVVDIVTNGR